MTPRGSILGTAVRRVEDPELILGRGTFVDNLAQSREGVLHAVFVRSPFAHADVTRLETADAAAAPGVVGVFTGEDLGERPVPMFASSNDAVDRFALARERVQYVGDPVALVVAESRALAVDAAELVDVDYEPLAVVIDPERAAEPGAPQLYDVLPRNVAIRRVDEGDPLTDAEVVVRARIENNRLATAPIEGNAILADASGDGDHTLTVWLSTQHPHLGQRLFARLTGLDRQADPGRGAPRRRRLRRQGRHLDRPRRGRPGRDRTRPGGRLDRDPQRGDALDARAGPGPVRRARADPRWPDHRAAGPGDR